MADINKFTFGDYSQASIGTNSPFRKASYTDPTTEQDTRDELGYPLWEIQKYLWDFSTITSGGDYIQLKLDFNDNKLKYSVDNGTTWNAITFYGEQGDPGNGVPDTTGLVTTDSPWCVKLVWENDEFVTKWAKIDQTYNSSSTNPISGQAIASAIVVKDGSTQTFDVSGTTFSVTTNGNTLTFDVEYEPNPVVPEE